MKTYYTVEGSVRGNVSIRHRSLDAAIRVLRRDQSACHSLGGGAYSDCSIYLHSDDCTELMVEIRKNEFITQSEANAEYDADCDESDRLAALSD